MTTIDQAISWLPAGWEQHPLGRATSASARDLSPIGRYRDNRGWLVRWTMYAELLSKAKYEGVRGKRTTAGEKALAWIGAPDRYLYQELRADVQLLPPVVLGRKLLDEVLLPAIFTANEEYATNATEAELKTVLAWYHALTATKAAKAEDDAGKRLNGNYEDMTKTLTAARWEKGLFEPEHFPARSENALQYLTVLLEQRLLPLRRDDVSAFGPNDLSVLLPPKLAKKLRDKEAEMLDFRTRNADEPVVQEGIGVTGRLEILQALLPQLARRMLRKQSMLVLGPTSSGKSYAGRITASYCKHRNQKAIILMPIKALVTQAVQEWEEWLSDTGLTWNIVAGSRDYPHHDDSLVRGEFDIAVMIPEKLAALLGRGMRLDNVGVIVTDELQMLTADYRGTRLEMLITRLRHEYPRIPIVALAAQLDDASTERIRRWLNIDTAAVIRAKVRPVPLEKIVRGGESEEAVLRSDGSSTELRPITDAGGTVATRAMGRMNPYQSRVLTLCLDLLAERGLDGEFSTRGILCFVQARNHAEQYAKIIQEASAVVKALGLPKPGIPHLGRFSSLSTEEAEARYRRFSRIPESRERQQVVDALRTGIGFHTARLDPFLREEMEWGFQKGLIRLLFATDTLKLGINLPADVVVVASITTPNNVGTSSIIDRDTVAQRLGRAGRLGISQRGRGYLVIPSTPLPDGDYEFASGDEAELASYIQQAGNLDTVRRRALAALADRDTVFKHYIKYRERGVSVISRLDEETLAILLLEHSKRIFEPQQRDVLAGHVRKMFDLSLKAQEADAAERISPASVVESLVESGLLSAPQPDYVRITALGRAIGHSGLPLSDAPAVERMASALTEGAGHLTLLFAATQTKQVVDSTTWVAIRRDLPAEAETEQKRGVIELARLLVDGVPEDSAITLPTAKSALLRGLVNNDDLIGTGTMSGQLRGLIDLTTLEPSLDEINALLRATVLLLWMRGCPFPIIREVVGICVRHRQEKSSKIEPTPPIHPADVRSLGENTSYVFDTVSDLTGVLPENNHFRLFERMSDAIAYGLPVELTPLARLNLRATHRDRLVHLVSAVRAGERPDLATLVRSNVRDPRVKAPTRQQRDEWQNQLFEAPEYRAIVAELNARQSKNTRLGRSLPLRIADERIAGDYTCQTMVDNLSGDDATIARDYLIILFDALGLGTEALGTDMLVLTSMVHPERTLMVRVVTTEVTLSDAQRWAEDGALIVACAGVSLDVVTAPLVETTRQSVVVEPSILIESLYRVLELETATSPVEFGDVEPRFDPDDPQLGVETLGLDELTLGLDLLPPNDFELGSIREETGDRVMHILHSAPPLLSRTDASRLLDGVQMQRDAGHATESDPGSV